MDLITNDPTLGMGAPGSPLPYAVDMEVAGRTSLPVLISAPKACALAMAIEIAVGHEGQGADGVVVVDAADERYLTSTMARAASADLGALRAVVVHDVDALDRAQQLTLMALATNMADHGTHPCRIIATTSVPLFDRVVQGSFDAALFYRLNNIHIKVGALLPQVHD